MARKRIYAFPADFFGCGQYRIIQPAIAHAQCTGEPLPVIDAITPPANGWDGLDASAVVSQRPKDDQLIAYWRAFKQYNPSLPLILDLDDLLWQPHTRSTFKITRDEVKNLDASMALADRLIASTEPLRIEMERRYKRSVIVRPNAISRQVFRAPIRRMPEEKLRVVWAGSASHIPDLEALLPVVDMTLDRYEWYFMGYTPPSLVGKVREVPHTHSFNEYLPTLARIGAHVAIAPLESNIFNECKSNLKLLEYGALGMATVASDVYPYRGSAAAMVTRHRPRNWLRVLADMEDEDLRYANALRSQAYARQFTLEETGTLLEASFGGFNG